MRNIRYLVATSLDGYIAGPNGEADWIGIDSEVDFGAIWAQFDTLLMGRLTYEAGRKRLGEKASQERRPLSSPGLCGRAIINQ